MKKFELKNIVNTAITIILLTIEFILCRYWLLDLHMLIDLSQNLFIFGLVVIFFSFFANSIKIMYCTVFGYIVGFFSGLLFEEKWVDKYGMSRSNMWIWFVCCMVSFVIIGILWELVHKSRKTGD